MNPGMVGIPGKNSPGYPQSVLNWVLTVLTLSSSMVTEHLWKDLGLAAEIKDLNSKATFLTSKC